MGKVEYQEEDREREGERWMCGIRLAAGLLGGAGQKQFTQNMVKIFNERNKTNIQWILLYLVSLNVFLVRLMHTVQCIRHRQ